MELQFPAMDLVSILPFIFCGRVRHMYLSGQLSSEAVAEKVSVVVFVISGIFTFTTGVRVSAYLVVVIGRSSAFRNKMLSVRA